MDRRFSSLRLLAIVTALGLLPAAVGCKSALETATLLWNGTDVAPDYDGFKDAHVAIVCKTLTAEEFSNSGVARQLSEGIYDRLKVNNKKIHLIDPHKVARLLDEKGLEDPLEIGKQLKADKVLVVEIESFGVLDGQTLFRGRAKYHVRVLDVASGEEQFHKQPPQIEWPSYGPKPAQDTNEPEFRNKFVGVMADKIGRYFYPHDRYATDDDEVTW